MLHGFLRPCGRHGSGADKLTEALPQVRPNRVSCARGRESGERALGRQCRDVPSCLAPFEARS